MRAFIYAAGRATRLGPALSHIPKILLSFGGRTLLEWHVRRLSRLGIGEITVVTGHLHDQVTATTRPLSDRYGVNVKALYNPDYTEGSALSVAVSLPLIEQSPNGVLLLDGDVLYDAPVLERLVHSRHPTVLLIDRGYSLADDDPVLVPVRRGRPFEFRKKWQGVAEHVGESIGFFRVGPADIPLLAEETRTRSVGLGRLDSYDEIIRAMVRQGRFGYEDVTGLTWVEIDYPQDIAYAEEHVLPHLVLAAERSP